MATHILTGTRIRERRIIAGLRQAALAQSVGISASYLNLIEHNRRRIGGKLLADIAVALNADVAGLVDGAGDAVIHALQDAAADMEDLGAETDKVEEFAGRFPGWAAIVAAQHRRNLDLQRSVEELVGRASQDPHLAEALHELLSTVTAIGSAASILVDTQEIEDEWRERFHRNIHEDSQRLAGSSQALVNYLESVEDETEEKIGPQDELEIWLETRDFYVAELERALPQSNYGLFQATPGIRTKGGQHLAETYFSRYHGDATAMPLRDFTSAIEELGADPMLLSRRFATDPSAAMRRLAAIPTPDGKGRLGLAVCDGSGTLTFKKPTEGFGLPRFGAACPLWPLYQALARPMTPIRAVVETTGRDSLRFLTFAYARPILEGGFDGPSVFEATMLIIPPDRAVFPETAPQQIGMSCRVCPRNSCTVRREISVLQQTDS